MHNIYQQLLKLAHDQVAARQRGDLETALHIIDARARLIEGAPPASSEGDRAAIHEVLRLDRELSSAIRARMIEVRNEVAAGVRGHQALVGYRPARSASSHWVEAHR